MSAEAPASSRSNRATLPSTSVNRNVTVPAGRVNGGSSWRHQHITDPGRDPKVGRSLSKGVEGTMLVRARACRRSGVLLPGRTDHHIVDVHARRLGHDEGDEAG